MEKIQSHDIKDIWRVRDGLLVEIYKYEYIGHSLGSDAKTKIIRGCKGLKELTEDFIDSYWKQSYPKGTFIYGHFPVKPIYDPYQFKAEIKSSGGSILGSFVEIEKVLEDIKLILNNYR
jgi:hypothetical protein